MRLALCAGMDMCCTARKVPKKKMAKEIQDFTGAAEAYPRAVIITRSELFSDVEKGYFNN